MIRARGLTKRYGAVRAVEDVSFELAPGEVAGFLGPNGAGKSTTMRMLCGVLEPDAGSIEIGGLDLAADPRGARARLGYLPEHNPLYRELPVDLFLDFAARARGLGRSERRRAMAEALEACDLEGMERRRIRELSKGYRQRVGLAQALLGDPPVLVLDEPTSGLDPAEIVRIRALVARLAGSRTVLLSTHVLSEVEELATRVLILSGGRLVADGAPGELAAAEGRTLVVVLRAPRAEARAALTGLAGVADARPGESGESGDSGDSGPDDSGRARFELEVDDPTAAAEAVAALAAERGWALSELRPVEPDLEALFLRRTAGTPAAGEARG